MAVLTVFDIFLTVNWEQVMTGLLKNQEIRLTTRSLGRTCSWQSHSSHRMEAYFSIKKIYKKNLQPKYQVTGLTRTGEKGFSGSHAFNQFVANSVATAWRPSRGCTMYCSAGLHGRQWNQNRTSRAARYSYTYRETMCSFDKPVASATEVPMLAVLN